MPRTHQLPPGTRRARPREAIERLITDPCRPLVDRTLWSMLYSTAAPAAHVLGLNVTDLDLTDQRAQGTGTGGQSRELRYDLRTARMLRQLVGRRSVGPVFLSPRPPPHEHASGHTMGSADIDPISRRHRMTAHTAHRHLAAATNGWTLPELRHARLTHAAEDGATETELMTLSGHYDRRALRRYLTASTDPPPDHGPGPADETPAPLSTPRPPSIPAPRNHSRREADRPELI